jgi:ABC-type iron transport system FetAB ATPase subunit
MNYGSRTKKPRSEVHLQRLHWSPVDASIPSDRFCDPYDICDSGHDGLAPCALPCVAMLLNRFPQAINRARTNAPSDFQIRLAIRELRSSHAGPITLDVAAGECVAIIGESGSGKSVFLRMIADLDPCSGVVLLEGTSRETWPASTWRSMVVYHPAEPVWWKPTAEAHFSAGQRDFARHLLPALNLKPGVWNAEITRLSTGERQRLALIRSLACKPMVLLLDEPAASLDPASTIAMEALLQTNLRDGMSIVIVTHSPQQAERLAHRELRMVHGQLDLT